MNPDTSDRPMLNLSRPVHADMIITIPLVFLLGMVSPRTATAEPLFAAPFRAFATGAYPASVAIGDLNADGKSDLVVATDGHWPVGSVSLLLGNGDGTFGPKTDYATGTSPRSLAIGDLNGDGNLDLATANLGADTISVLLGNGDGTFEATKDYGTGPYPRSLAIGDLNGDGHPDLTATNSGSDMVSVLLNNGDGTFGTKTDYGTGSSPGALAIGDLDGDGHPDLAVANPGQYPAYGNTVSVLLNNGDGTFGMKTDYDTGSSPGGLAIDDLNGDGNPDLAVAHPSQSPANGNTVSVLLGNGDGTLGVWTDYATGKSPASVAIGDLNGDGHPDLTTTNINDSSVSVLLGHGDGSFGVKTDYLTENSPMSVAIGDLNDDGRLDLAVANYRSNSVSALLGHGDGSFGAEILEFHTGNWPSSVAIGDLNADGKPDLAAANNGDGSVSVLLGHGDGSFGTKTDFDTGGGTASVTIVDLNGDDKPDLVVPLLGTFLPGYGGVAVLLGNGDGSFQPMTGFGTGSAVSVAIGDLNADGMPDVAVANNVGDFVQSGRVSVLLGNGDGSFGAITDYPTSGLCQSVAIGDLNADGMPDLVTGTSANPYGGAPPGSVSVRFGTGGGSFGPNTDYYAEIESLSCVAIGDLNGDGTPDLAAAGSNAFSVLLGNGDGSFGLNSVFQTGVGTGIVAIGDLNGDGTPDLAASKASSNAVWILLGNGDGSFRADGDYGVALRPLSMAVGDLNGDAKPDLVVPSYDSNTVSVLLNINPPPCPAVPMSFKLMPSTLNLRSMGRWVTGVLEPGSPASPATIDLASIRLNGSVPVDPAAPTSIGDADNDGRPDLKVKFDRAAVMTTVERGDAVTIAVSGEMGSDCFEATDVIRVIGAHGSTPDTSKK